MTDTNNLSWATKARIGLAFLAIYLIWGTTFLGIRIAVETIPAFMMAGLRFFFAGGIMMVILLARGGHFPSLRHWRSAVIVGGLMLVGGIGLVSFAEERISSGLAALVVATIPIWITLFGWLGFGGKKPSPQIFTGLGLGFVGVILLFAPAIDADNNQLAGMGIVFIGAMFFAAGSLYSRRAPLPIDTRMSTASEMLAAGILLLGVSLLSGEPSRLDIGEISVRSIFALIYLTIFGSIIGYTAYLWLLKTVEPAKVSTNFYVNPVIAVFMGWLLADENVTLFMIIATVVILLGVAVINIKLPHIGQRRNHEIKLNMGGTSTE
ncbi:MAG: drug/metabolite exporter YedA [Chloroflexota bacterium]|nr:multidrug transporter [Chloroflexota bacterium]NOG63812.1 EamA family transporter [Chloroflexota bacterium]GIK63922.1 MAG: drug/metabolite exporter YedA [Chloroflexota bacterium]